MTMNRFHNRGDRSRPRVNGVTIALLLVVVTVLSVASMPQLLTQFSHTLMRPFVSMRASVGETVISAVDVMKTTEELQLENERLQEELHNARFELLVARLLRAENKELKEALGRYIEHHAVHATVLRRPPDTLYDTLVIDVGKRHGIAVGDMVVAHNVVLGVVRKVLDTTSTVVMYSAPGEQVSVMVGDGASTTPALAQGMGAGNYVARIPRGLSVDVGAIVALPTMNTHVFGTVEEIISRPSDSFTSVLFQVPLNMNEITNVIVVTNEYAQTRATSTDIL